MKNTGLRCTALCVTTLTLLLCSPALLAQEVYRARLSPMPTTPQTVDEITGEGEVIVTLNGNTLTVQGSFAGMSSNATAAHIHSGPLAQPGPVAHTLSVDQAPAGSISGSVELTPAQLTALANNALYVQVHSANNPPGELRGWLFLRSHFDDL